MKANGTGRGDTQEEVIFVRHEPRRFLADTNHLSAVALGALVRLRDKMLISGGRLPDDDGMLARIAQVDRKTFSKLRDEIGLKRLDDGTVTLPEAERMLVEVRKFRADKQRAANIRWGNVQAQAGKFPDGGGDKSLTDNNPPHAHAYQSQSQLQKTETATNRRLSKGLEETAKPSASCVAELSERYAQNEPRIMRVWAKIERKVTDIRSADALLRKWCATEDWCGTHKHNGK